MDFLRIALFVFVYFIVLGLGEAIYRMVTKVAQFFGKTDLNAQSTSRLGIY